MKKNKKEKKKVKEEKVTFFQKRMLKIANKRMLKEHKKLEKVIGKDAKEERKQREKLIKYIWQMTDMFNIYEDDNITPITTESLSKKKTKELMGMLEEMMEMTLNKAKNG